MSNKNGRAARSVKVVVQPGPLPPIPPMPNSPFTPATQARLDRAGLRMEQAKAQWQQLQEQVQAARDFYNDRVGALKGVLEAALEEEGFSPETQANFRDGHVHLVDPKKVGDVLQMLPEEPPAPPKKPAAEKK